MKTLTIIDMQEAFLEKEQQSIVCKTVAHIRRIIWNFQDKGWPILIVEFGGFNSTTTQRITNLLINYQPTKTIQKHSVSGAKPILNYVRRMKWPLDFAICGIYGDQCIAATVDDLIRMEPKVSIGLESTCIFPQYQRWTENKEKHDKKVTII